MPSLVNEAVGVFKEDSQPNHRDLEDLLVTTRQLKTQKAGHRVAPCGSPAPAPRSLPGLGPSHVLSLSERGTSMSPRTVPKGRPAL